MTLTHGRFLPREQEWGGRYTRPFLVVARVWQARLGITLVCTLHNQKNG